MATSPYEFTNAINFSKIDMCNDPQVEKDYTPFITNRSLSYFPDTLFYANEMNMHPSIPKKWQFDYYINVIPKKKRFFKQEKKIISEDLEAVKSYYNTSNRKAEEILTIVTVEQLEFIKKSLYKGGKDSK